MALKTSKIDIFKYEKKYSEYGPKDHMCQQLGS